MRDVYDLGDALLIVATDRISAFDVILPTGIPDKGRVLTALSRFWFEKTAGHRPEPFAGLATWTRIGARLHDAGVTVTADLVSMLEGRSQLVRKCDALPLECVVRGYLDGSAWKDYQTLFAHGGEVKLYDIPVPVGLRQGDKLPDAALHARHQSPHRPRHEHLVRPGRRGRRRGDGPGTRRQEPRPVRLRPRLMPPSAA